MFYKRFACAAAFILFPVVVAEEDDLGETLTLTNSTREGGGDPAIVRLLIAPFALIGLSGLAWCSVYIWNHSLVSRCIQGTLDLGSFPVRGTVEAYKIVAARCRSPLNRVGNSNV